MSRELRMVPKDWEHPKNESGRDKPLHMGYVKDAKEFMEIASKEGLQEAVEYMGCPDKGDYMPDWADEEKTHYMMYETCSEGTPISPACEFPEGLAHWLEDNNASSFGRSTATYDQWLKMIKGPGWAISAISDGKTIVSGVEGLNA